MSGQKKQKKVVYLVVDEITNQVISINKPGKQPKTVEDAITIIGLTQENIDKINACTKNYKYISVKESMNKKNKS